MEAIKTAYSTAYHRLLILAQSGRIGNIVAVDATCTSLHEIPLLNQEQYAETWNSICGWGPTAMLPILQLLGTEYIRATMTSAFAENSKNFDIFTKIDFLYPHATATLKVGKGIKSEGELIISGSLGYIYVPAPWWKTDYFEIRYEDQRQNKRYFYQLDGEGIQYEVVNFIKSIEKEQADFYISRNVSRGITRMIEKFYSGKDLERIQIKQADNMGEIVGR
jgi:choline-phosphate cytidylyltransferase